MVFVLELEEPLPVLDPLTELELVPPWLVLFSAPVLGALLIVVLLELLPVFGSSPVEPAPPWFLLQPTSAKAAQTIRINLFI